MLDSANNKQINSLYNLYRCQRLISDFITVIFSMFLLGFYCCKPLYISNIQI